ncbi:MAG: peptide-methionine (S)-S-oxide reductase MsrA [Methanoregula sp.]|nr:peptide-methionine (S)-S-oxide reductase MsrA [Methanoregula sp.]
MDGKQETGKELMKATFAGGCFWCMQPPFRKVEGVIEVVSGYAGGVKVNPTYEEVSSGTTGHLESVQVTFDPGKISYETLLDIFWRQIDPNDPEGQFADRGSQYRTAIFYHDDEQKRRAELSKKKLEESGKFAKSLVTEIRPYTSFYPAEEYHQDYDRKNPRRYQNYKVLSGREPFIKKTWNLPRQVRIYATPGCTACRSVKSFLKSRNVEFTEIDLASDEEARDFVIKKTGYISSPIVQIGDDFIIGFDQKKMEKLLQ